MDNPQICHGMITHDINEPCEFCREAQERMERDFLGIYYRTGIKTIINSFFGTLELCDAHGYLWEEGSNFTDQGGSACRDCIERAKVVPLEEIGEPTLDKCSNK